ncbi:MAG: hypothetical protein ACLQBY_13120 [Solirubrobacteraceae bacterium]
MPKSSGAQHTIASRLSTGAALDARVGAVHEHAHGLRSALTAFLTEHRRGLEHANGLLAPLPHRAARELAVTREGIPALAATVAGAGHLLASLGHDVRDQATRVQSGTHRQLHDHGRDFGRALARLMREARDGIDRRAVHAREDLSRQRERLGESTHRRLTGARRDTSHAAALIAALDFRHRGWLLASIAGTPVRATADLKEGQRVDLQLHDGRAATVVENVNPEPGSRKQ